MKIDVVTLFPEFFDAPLKTSLLGKAVAAGRLEITAHDLRAWGIGPHRSVDDEPYGGGAGMVMRPEPLFAAVDALRGPASRVILLSPRGRVLNQRVVEELATSAHLVLLCGRYEGVDERVAEHAADEEISVGDYVLAGGETAALVVIDAVARVVPGVVGNERSLASESHTAGRLEHPHYTRPPEFRGLEVPEILLSGNHAEIERWRREASERTTRERRPDLLRGEDAAHLD